MVSNCNQCADPSCDGREYKVNYDYDYFGRKRGSKIVCSSQVSQHGFKFIHTITEGKYSFKFEAIPLNDFEDKEFIGDDVSEDEEFLNLIKGVNMDEVDSILESLPYGVIDEETDKDETVSSVDTGESPRQDGGLQEQPPPSP